MKKEWNGKWNGKVILESTEWKWNGIGVEIKWK